MNTPLSQLRSRRAAGFSLIEMIGVLAIMAILAGVLAPNAIRAIDRAAVLTERQSLRSLGEELKLYLRDQGTLPTTSNWTTELATYADLNPTDLATNPRGMARRFLLDPAASPVPRVLFLSSLRNGLNLPTSGNINTASEFDAIWNTADGQIPPTSSWSGWNAWAAVGGSADFLVIERVNLKPVYRTDLLSLTVTLNNLGSTTVSYNHVSADGVSGSVVNIAAGGTVILNSLRPRERINLYAASSGGSLDYSYVLTSTGQTFDFDGTQWLPR